jgi:hypothetical protein
MSLLPPSGTHKNPDSYAFVNSAGSVMLNATVAAPPAQGRAKFGITNQNGTVATPNVAYVEHYMTNTAADGLIPAHYQLFLYGAGVGGNGVAEVFDVYGNGNNDAIMDVNLGIPLDVARIGTFTGTGAPLAVACLSISAASVVQCAFVGGVLPGAAPVIVNTAGVGFTANAQSNSIYSYVVYG